MSELTVVLINYNNSHWLPECLQSINRQSLETFDVIVVDDQSTDDSLSVLNNFPWRQGITAKICENPINVGVSISRSLGFDMVRTPYVTNIDSDDYYYSERKLEAELNLAKSNPGDVAFSKIVEVDNQNNQITRKNQRLILEGCLDLPILRREIMIPRDFVMTMETYRAAGGYDTSLSLYEDWDLKLRIAKLANFRYTGIDGVAYRRHGSGLSSAPIAAHHLALSRVILKNLINFQDRLTITELCQLASNLGLCKSERKSGNDAR